MRRALYLSGEIYQLILIKIMMKQKNNTEEEHKKKTKRNSRNVMSYCLLYMSLCICMCVRTSMHGIAT